VLDRVADAVEVMLSVDDVRDLAGVGILGDVRIPVRRDDEHPRGRLAASSRNDGPDVGRQQKCEVRPASDATSAFSYQEYAYFPSSRSFASCDSFSGWNVSHITASSVVSCMPIDFSASPGCGPCGSPDGCRVIEPTSTPRREPKLPET
jgi:hypothetical protein